MSNVLLDELDKELERRGHKFCRYADDCNVYVKSRSAGERVKESIGKRRKERSRPTVEEEVSGLHDDVAPGAANESSGKLGETAEDEAPGDTTAGKRTQHWETNRRRTDAAAERLDELLPASRGEGDL
jgi:hypothetical protein